MVDGTNDVKCRQCIRVFVDQHFLSFPRKKRIISLQICDPKQFGSKTKEYKAIRGGGTYVGIIFETNNLAK